MMVEDDLELSEDTIKEMKKSRDEYKKGKKCSLDEVKKEINRK